MDTFPTGDAMVGWPDSCLFRVAGTSAAMGDGEVGRGNDPENVDMGVSSSSWGYPNSWMVFVRENPI